MTLSLRPVTLREARAFVATHHSHNEPPHGWRFGVGVDAVEGPSHHLVAVGLAGTPVARALADGQTIEITRVATDCTRMACSMAYGALCRAARALGWRRAITYTLESECAACVRGAGFVLDSVAGGCGDARGFDRPRRPRVESNLFGDRRRPDEAKTRWVRELT